MRITEFARKTGATLDELRYIEKKGFITSRRTRIKQREVRQFQETDIRKIELIIKYRRQGFTWDTAFNKASQEMEKPSLL
jgi:DNA-binding transcriptional MerR regulator